MKVAVKTPRECPIIADPASHATRRGEYAVALNCTITKASEKTRPVSGNIPEAMADSRAIAALTLIGALRPGRKRASRRGTVRPRRIEPTA